MIFRPLPFRTKNAIWIRIHAHRFGRVKAYSVHQAESGNAPRDPVEVDKSYQTLFRDVDLSLLKQKARKNPKDLQKHFAVEVKEGEESPLRDKDEDGEESVSMSMSVEEEDELDYRERKSPAAAFGSKGIGAVVLPLELQDSISTIISNLSNKSLLHSDATRIFRPSPTSDWDLTLSSTHTYKSHRQATRHTERDGVAFASISLPPQYAVIYRVLSDLVWRLGESSWGGVDRVYEWGGGLGAGVLASLNAFRSAMIGVEGAAKDPGGVGELEPEMTDKPEDVGTFKDSTVTQYWIFDKNKGLVEMGKKILAGIQHTTSILYQRGTSPEDNLPPSASPGSLALSAFGLSALPKANDRKEQVKAMWRLRTEYIVLIDYGTPAGFEAIAEAREQILKLGRKVVESEDSSTATTTDVAEDVIGPGCHVIAPCPHSLACPILSFQKSLPSSHSSSHSSHNSHSDSHKTPPPTLPNQKPKLTCKFSQRLERPSFLRKTKNSGRGHEDMSYSYVVIRRGPPPTMTMSDVAEGGGGGGRVGRERRRVVRDSDAVVDGVERARQMDVWIESEDGELVRQSQHHTDENDDLLPSQSQSELSDSALTSLLRSEAHTWPRLIVPPLKRSGHVVMDTCTSSGEISRMTIPRSQGRQAYYDARKSSWGDIFPHGSKNRVVVRYGSKGSARGKAGEDDEREGESLR